MTLKNKFLKKAIEAENLQYDNDLKASVCADIAENTAIDFIKFMDSSYTTRDLRQAFKHYKIVKRL